MDMRLRLSHHKKPILNAVDLMNKTPHIRIRQVVHHTEKAKRKKSLRVKLKRS